jgi:hypothetical protein
MEKKNTEGFTAKLNSKRNFGAFGSVSGDLFNDVVMF